MKKFIFLTFAFLGWGFYELSGGADFEPGAQAVAQAEPPAAPEVGRADTSSPEALVSLPRPPRRPVGDLPDISLVTRREPAMAVAETRETPAPDPVAEIVEDVAAALAAAPVSPTRQQPRPDPVSVVTGNVVNMRSGPGTHFAVLGQLRLGDDVRVIGTSDNGWVKLRVLESDRVGWMAARFVEPAGD